MHDGSTIQIPASNIIASRDATTSSFIGMTATDPAGGQLPVYTWDIVLQGSLPAGDKADYTFTGLSPAKSTRCPTATRTSSGLRTLGRRQSSRAIPGHGLDVESLCAASWHKGNGPPVEPDQFPACRRPKMKPWATMLARGKRDYRDQSRRFDLSRHRADTLFPLHRGSIQTWYRSDFRTDTLYRLVTLRRPMDYAGGSLGFGHGPVGSFSNGSGL